MTRQRTQRELDLTDKLTAALAKTYEEVVGEAIKDGDWTHDEVLTTARNSYSRLLIGHFWVVRQVYPGVSMVETAKGFCSTLIFNAQEADKTVGANVPEEAKH